MKKKLLFLIFVFGLMSQSINSFMTGSQVAESNSGGIDYRENFVNAAKNGQLDLMKKILNAKNIGDDEASNNYLFRAFAKSKTEEIQAWILLTFPKAGKQIKNLLQNFFLNVSQLK